MKKKILAALVTGLFLVGMVGVANGLYIQDANNDYIPIGDYDSFVAQTTQAGLPGSGNSPENELAWINFMLNSTYTLEDFEKIESEIKVNGVNQDNPLWVNNWEEVYSNDNGTLADPEGWAFELTVPTDYFMVKTGTMVTGDSTEPDYRYFLFRNNANLEWGAFQLEGDDYYIAKFGKLSHISQVGGTTPVPEPATMLLFGTGLVGLAGIARRRNKK